MTEKSLYEMALYLIGVVPPQYEFIYIIGTFILFMCLLYVLFFGLIILKKVVDK